jgi:DNA-binding SARP family transcriptional activator
MECFQSVAVLMLGNVEVQVARERLDLTPMECSLAAVLGLAIGRPMQVAAIVDAIWPDNPPGSVRNRVQVLVSSLRHKLDRAGVTGVIETAARGYRLNAAKASTDVQEFDRLTAAAKRLAVDDASEAAVQYRTALALWRGPALDGLGPLQSGAEAALLSELRVGAQEAAIELDLSLGRAAEVIGELRALVSAHPLRERLRSQLMRALIDTGRPADALAAYRQFRDLLTRDLGLEPTAQLRQLQQEILTRPASAGTARVPHPPTPTTIPAPCQLPPDQPTLVRLGEAARLVAAVRAAADTARPGRGVAAVVVGPRATGKSALAINVAWRLLADYPQGCLYVDLRAADREGTLPHDLVGSFLRALGLPAQLVPEDPQERVGLYRSVLVGIRVLVVLDNATSHDAVRMLMPTGRACATLVTSRRPALAGMGTLTVTLAPHPSRRKPGRSAA